MENLTPDCENDKHKPLDGDGDREDQHGHADQPEEYETTTPNRDKDEFTDQHLKKPVINPDIESDTEK